MAARAPRPLAVADLVTVVFSLAMAAVGAWVVFAGPTQMMPVHWGPDGYVDRWGTRAEVGGLILMLGFTALAIGGGLGLAARRVADTARVRTLRIGQVVSLIAISAVALFAGAASLGGAQSLAGALPMAALSLILLAAGGLTGRVGPNRWVGVRTPWSLNSRIAWARSNRLAAALLIPIGLGGLVLSPLAPQPLGMQALVGGAILAAIWSVIESRRAWHNDPDRQPL